MATCRFQGIKQASMWTVTLALFSMGFDSQGATVTVDDQIKELQAQISLLQQQAQLTTLQQTQQATAQTAVLTALKTQAAAQSDLDKATSQGQFASIAGIKAGMDLVGTPVGKDGKLTVTTGTAGALMLKLKEPMLLGLWQVADDVAKVAKKQEANLGGGLYIATDAQVQSALQSTVTKEAIRQTAVGLQADIEKINVAGFKPQMQAAFFTEAAAAGLFLNTAVGLEKFFRVDRTSTIFDSGDEANQVLQLMLQRQLQTEGVAYVNAGDVAIASVLKISKEAQDTLNGVKSIYDSASALSTEIDKLPAADPKKPAQADIDRLKADVATTKDMLDALHPARKPDSFWTYVQGLCMNARMLGVGDAYKARLIVNAKAQTVQIVESRTWRSDKIYGTADVQVDYRFLKPDSTLLTGELILLTFSDPTTSSTKYFPARKP